MSASRNLAHEEDVIINTRMYGIYNPKNFHSFQPTLKIFLPTTCLVCNQTIYPLIEACYCLRCEIYSHRKCIHVQPPCCLFTFQHNKTESTAIPQPTRLSNSKIQIPSNEKDEEYGFAFVVKLEHIVAKACMIPAVLGHIPEPRSHFCIWKSILRAVALKHNNLRENLVHFDPELSPEEIEQTVVAELNDQESFPAQVSFVCVYTFLSIQYTSISSMLQHARECIDVVLCAFLAVKKESYLTEDRQMMSILSVAIDRFLLTRDHEMMYAKIFNEIKQSTAHRTLLFTGGKVNTKDFPVKWRRRCVRLSERVAAQHAPADKLDCLVQLLQYVAMLSAIRPRPPREKEELPQAAPAGSAIPAEAPTATQLTESGLNDSAVLIPAPIPRLDSREYVSIPVESKVEAGAAAVGGSGVREMGVDLGTIAIIDEIEENTEVQAVRESADYVKVGEAGGRRGEEVERRLTSHGGDDKSVGAGDFEDPVDSEDEREAWMTYGNRVAKFYERQCSSDSMAEQAEDADTVLVSRHVHDTDRMLEMLIYVIYTQQRDKVVDWLAESRYLDSELAYEDQQGITGPRGYALVTLQQAMACLLQNNQDL